MTEFMNFDRREPEDDDCGDEPKNHGRRGRDDKPKDDEGAPPPKNREKSPEPEPVDDLGSFPSASEIFHEFALSQFKRNAPREQPELRSILRAIGDDLDAFIAAANRPSGSIGFRTDGPSPISVTPLGECLQRAIIQLKPLAAGDGAADSTAFRMRQIAQAALTEVREFYIGLTQSNFRSGIIPEGELTGVLLGTNRLAGNLSQRLIAFDALSLAQEMNLELDLGDAA